MRLHLKSTRIPNRTKVLATWQAITASSFGLTIGGVINTFSSLDFSEPQVLQMSRALFKPQFKTGTGSQWTSATVTYANNGFHLVGGSAVAAAIPLQAGSSGTDITGLNLLDWLPASVYPNNIYSSAL